MRSPTPRGLRPPTDHWVDRPEMEAPQGVELTGTNRPRTCPHLPARRRATHPLYSSETPHTAHKKGRPQKGHSGTVSQSYGGHSGRETPGPIPNPEAKPASADGTAPEGVWESRTPPDNCSRSPGRGLLLPGLRSFYACDRSIFGGIHRGIGPPWPAWTSCSTARRRHSETPRDRSSRQIRSGTLSRSR